MPRKTDYRLRPNMKKCNSKFNWPGCASSTLKATSQTASGAIYVNIVQATILPHSCRKSTSLMQRITRTGRWSRRRDDSQMHSRRRRQQSPICSIMTMHPELAGLAYVYAKVSTRTTTRRSSQVTTQAAGWNLKASSSNLAKAFTVSCALADRE